MNDGKRKEQGSRGMSGENARNAARNAARAGTLAAVIMTPAVLGAMVFHTAGRYDPLELFALTVLWTTWIGMATLKAATRLNQREDGSRDEPATARTAACLSFMLCGAGFLITRTLEPLLG